MQYNAANAAKVAECGNRTIAMAICKIYVKS